MQESTVTFYSEGATVGDFNRDGNPDVASGPFWYAGPEFRERHAYMIAKPRQIKGYSDHFFSWVLDLDGDGDLDIVTVGMPGQPGWWYRNPGSPRRRGAQRDRLVEW